MTLSKIPSLSDLPESVVSRVTFQPQDFFTPQLSQSTDVFFLRKILHDWPLSEARQILGHIAAAMKPAALVVVMELILPMTGTGRESFSEARLRDRDLTMAQKFNASEREMEDWIELIE